MSVSSIEYMQLVRQNHKQHNDRTQRRVLTDTTASATRTTTVKKKTKTTTATGTDTPAVTETTIITTTTAAAATISCNTITLTLTATATTAAAAVVRKHLLRLYYIQIYIQRLNLYVCMYVCMHARMNVCMHVRIYMCMLVWLDSCTKSYVDRRLNICWHYHRAHYTIIIIRNPQESICHYLSPYVKPGFSSSSTPTPAALGLASSFWKVWAWQGVSASEAEIGSFRKLGGFPKVSFKGLLFGFL